MASFCLLRLGAPHAGHAALVEAMLASDPGPCLVLVGSSDVTGRPDVPLPWEERRELFAAILARRASALARLRYAPLPELRTDGWDARWCDYLLDAATRALGEAPERYVFGDDYEAHVFAHLGALTLHRVPRQYHKSARELRQALVSGRPELLAKYEEELAVYSEAARARIASVCADGVDRPPLQP